MLFDEKQVLEICKKYGIETVRKEGYPLYMGKEMDENFSIAEIMREPVTIMEDDKNMSKEIKYNMEKPVCLFKKKIGLFGFMWKSIR